MRFLGTRRARGISLLFVLLVVGSLAHATRRIGIAALDGLGPLVLARAEEGLGRKIEVASFHYREAGVLVVEGLRVGRGPSLDDGLFLTADRAELRYDPGLYHWHTLLSRGLGRDTAATLTADGVTLYASPTRGGEKLAAVPLATAAFDLGGVLRQTDEFVGTVDDVTLNEPEVWLTRSPTGEWNFEDLVDEPEEKEPTRFRGEVRVLGGTVDLVDYLPQQLSAPVVTRSRLDARVQWDGFPQVRLSAGGETLGEAAGRGTRFSLAGHTDDATDEWLVSLQASGTDLPHWYRYLSPAVDGLDLRQAAGTVSMVAWGRGLGEDADTPEYTALFDVTNAALHHAALPADIEQFRGRIHATPRAVVVDGAAHASRIPVQVAGEVLLNGLPQASLQLSAARVTLDEVRRLLPDVPIPEALVVTRPVTLSARVAGGDGVWRVEGALMGPDARYGDVGLSRVRLDFDGQVTGERLALATASLRAERVRLDGDDLLAEWDLGGEREGRDLAIDAVVVDGVAQLTVAGTAFGGALDARGWLRLDEEGEHDLFLEGEARDVELARAPLPRSLEAPGGVLNSSFVVSGTLEDPEVAAYVVGRGLTAQGERLETVQGRLQYVGGAWEIPSAVVDDPRLRATFSGSIDAEGALDLRGEARGINLATLLAGRVEEALEGNAYLSATVGGTLDAPEVAGRVQVYQPAIGEYQADYVEGGFRLRDLEAIELYDLFLRRDVISGRADSFQLTRLPGNAPAPELAGIESEELEIPVPGAGPETATPDRWRVDGEVLVEGLTVVRALQLAGVPMDQLRETPVAGDLGGISVALHGPLDELAIGVRGAGQAMAALGFDLGDVTFEAEVDTALGEVRVVRLDSASTALRAQAQGTVRWFAEAADGTTAPPELDLTLEASGLEVGPLLARFAPESREYLPVDGRVTHLAARMAGPASAPVGALTVSLGDLVVNGSPIAMAPVQIDYSPAAIAVTGVRLVLEEGVVSAPLITLPADDTGGFDFAGLTAELEVAGLPLARVRQLVEQSPFLEEDAAERLREALDALPERLAGVLRGTVRITPGESASPRIAGEFSMAGLHFLPIRLQEAKRLSARFDYDGERIDLSEIALDWGDHGRLQASGTVELGGDGGGALDVALSVERLDLEALAALPGVEERLVDLRPLAGDLRLQGHIGGTVEHPEARFDGEVLGARLAGVALDEAILEGGGYSAESGVLQLGTARLVKRRPNGAPPAMILMSDSRLPLAWPDLSSAVDAPRRVRLVVPRQSLSVLTELVDEIEAREGGSTPALAPVIALVRQAALSGEAEGDFVLGGTALEPRNSGFFAFRAERFDIGPLETHIRDFDIRLALEGDELRVVRFTGKSSREGQFTGDGSVRLGRDRSGAVAPVANLTFAVDQFKFEEKEVGSLVGEAFQGSHVEGVLQTVHPRLPGQPQPLQIRGTWPAVEVSGGLLLDDAVLYLVFQDLLQPGPVGELPPIGLDVALLTGPDVWLRNPMARLKLAGGLHATGTLREPRLVGELPTSRGVLMLPTLRLRNVEGPIRIAYDARPDLMGAGPAPVHVALAGTTRIRSRRNHLESEDYELTVEIRGSPGGQGDVRVRPVGLAGGLEIGSDSGGLTISIRSDPPLPANQIEALIRQQFGGEGFGGGGTNVVEALQSQVEQVLFVGVGGDFTSRLEDTLQSALGLDTFALDIGVTQPLRLRIGKQLMGNIFGTVTQEFGLMNDQQRWVRRFDLYYRINPRIRIGYRQEDPLGGKFFFISGVSAF
jgi:hypothetical protein